MTDPIIPQLVAHRGYMQHFPENTWVGLEAALQAGACWLEFDIQMCRDGRFVLLHDDTFARTANLDLSVFDCDSGNLQVSVHEPARLGDRFAATPVALLEDVLERIARFPRAQAMVEIKQESIDHWGLDTVMRNLLPCLREHREQCMLISYHAQALDWSRANSDLRIGWVLQAYDPEHRQLAHELEADCLICNQRKIPDHERPWPGAWRWMVYDVTEPGTALDWAGRGVTLVETADIGGMLGDRRLRAGACRHGL